jgi:CRP-like cAMP-binding protein
MPDVRSFDIPRFLSVLPLFSDLSADEVARIAEGCHLRRYERAEMIFRMGEPCNSFQVVVTGQVKLFVVSPSGMEKVIEIIGAGGSFAEALMFLGKPCMVNAQALSDSLLLSVHRHTVMEELRQDWRFSARMIAGLSRRLHGLVRDVQAYALQTGVQRVIGYLLSNQQPAAGAAGAHLAEGDAVVDGAEAAEGPAGAAGAPGAPEVLTVSLPVSKGTLASRLSLTPEYFSRVLRELEDAKLIEVDRRDIRILDARRLAAYEG